MRQSKEFTDSFVQRPNNILKYIFATLSNSDPVIFSTTSLLVSHIGKYLRELRKEDETL